MSNAAHERNTGKEATAGKKCCQRVMGDFNSYLCEKPAKVIEDGKPYCGIHDPEKKRKKYAAWSAEWEKTKELWSVEAAKQAEELRRLSRYDEAVRIMRLSQKAEPGSIAHRAFVLRRDEFLAEEPNR